MLKSRDDLGKNQEFQRLVADEICRAESGLSTRNVYQLRTILCELRSMEKAPHAALSYPHIIVDSWDFNDELGKELMRLAAEYEKL